MNDQEIQQIRSDFPILTEKVYNKPLIYFDNAATTQKPKAVLDRIMYGYEHLNANIHRGVHYLSQQATEAHEEARNFVAKYMNASESAEIIFTRGTTEAINLVACSFGELACKRDDEILISAMEHHSNIVPWQMLCERKGMKLRVIPMNEKGELRLDAYEKLLNEKTRIVALTHVSNVLGTINPVREMIAMAHAKNIPVLIEKLYCISKFTITPSSIPAFFFNAFLTVSAFVK